MTATEVEKRLKEAGERARRLQYRQDYLEEQGWYQRTQPVWSWTDSTTTTSYISWGTSDEVTTTPYKYG